MIHNVVESRTMSTANGWQLWDARPMSTLKAMDGNSGFDPQVEGEVEIRKSTLENA